jgi:hypothetical protein
MKKINLLFGLLTVLILISCSSDDDNSNSEITIIGTWKLIGGNSSSTGDYQLTDCSLMTRLTFNQNSTANFEEHFDDNNDCLEDNYTVNYSINDNSLSFSSNGEVNTFTFELTSTALSYSATENGVTDTTIWERVQ